MDRVALVTGGSGAVGGAIVRRFSQDGLKVAFTFLHHQERAEQLQNETNALGVQADLTDRVQVKETVQKVLEAFGHIDVLVNNAGLTQVMPFALIEEEDWDQVLTANLKTMFLVTKEVIRSMISRKRGVVINIGSLAGHRLLEVPVHYATAKAGVSGFTLSLAKELSRYNIRVNEVIPGLLSKGVGELVPEKERAEYLRYCATGRPGEPEEVAEAVAFLASEKAQYINAQRIFVDGGI
jgi:NAD(P)-dependent dehydrogenase (short-subunit alcohol dehydrogenase family)